jgi:16S rRNA (uracil1498-N3)-methyltransferase
VRVVRIYVDQGLFPQSTITLVDDAAHYLSRVLRLKPGALCRLFNGIDGEFEATVISANSSGVVVQTGSLCKNNANPTIEINIGLGLSRGERMDYAVQKSTELGVTSITPLFSDRCEVKLKPERVANRVKHWGKVAISACEQSGRSVIPTINQPLNAADWIKSGTGSFCIMLDQSGDTNLQELAKQESVNLMIGPEGGFSENEIVLARSNGFSVVRLGSRTLRTETAPVVALSILQYLWGSL